MNILVVEDSHHKCAKIVKALRGVPFETSIKTVTNAVDAKRHLTLSKVDFMILDMHLPRSASGDADKNGGLEIIRWLKARGAKHRPACVVGMTSDMETYRHVEENNDSLVWQVLQYDHTSDDWQNKLVQSVVDIRPTLNPPYLSDGATHRVDILVVTALRDPELDAVLALPFDFKKIDIPHDASDYYRGTIKSGPSAASIVAVHASDKGLSGAAIATVKGIMTFWPRYVFMTGITAGVKGRTRIGDVIFADLTWDWGSGKIKSVNGEDVFLPAPYQRRLDETLSRNVKEMSSDGQILKQAHESTSMIKPKILPVVKIGVMASGASVLQSQPAVQKVIDLHKDLLAVEMEAFSVMFSAQTAPQPRPLVIVAKAVSDAGDKKKNDHYQKYAAYTSAQAFKIFAEKYLMGHLSSETD
ncbi:hypothetical protein [Methylorubrum sp. POS3]|uniref:phosphorylase family protein n=1 Tax=Methylorubrum sp. POS3 TaxID=2998492 RepID=UPI00372C561D